MVLTLPELRHVVLDAAEVKGEAPFAVGEHYVSFLREEPPPEGVADFSEVERGGEAAVVRGRAVHLLVRDKESFQSAKLPGLVERRLGVATARNLRVVAELDRRWGPG